MPASSSRVDLAQAQTQLEQTRAQLVAENINRATFEHAVAVLAGKAPSGFSVEPGPVPPEIPTFEPGMPSTLLERRPDIASAERQMASANAQIGVAVAAYYPRHLARQHRHPGGSSLNAAAQLSNAVWSVGPQIAATLIDGGALRAQVEGARARYDCQVALYRQTILVAFQQIEDALVQQRVLVQQEQVQRVAVADARVAERLSLNQYQLGTVPYTTVVQTQAAALSAEQTPASRPPQPAHRQRQPGAGAGRRLARHRPAGALSDRWHQPDAAAADADAAEPGAGRAVVEVLVALGWVRATPVARSSLA